MEHWKRTPDGKEETEKIEVDPPIKSREEIEREIREGGGGGHGALPEDRGEGVQVDPHWVNLKLPDHPRGEGWIEPDPSKPVWPKD